jgi:hypothetical protein
MAPTDSTCLTGWEKKPNVIHLTSILRRLYVVKNFKRGVVGGKQHYHVCNTKWDRLVPQGVVGDL